MKKSRRTKSRHSSPYRSTRKQMEPASVRGLITSQERSIKTESQVSAYTQKSKRSHTFASSQDFDVDEQAEKEEIRQVFMSEEEEKVIQKILQVARKGKINQKNAFQIPLKVLDNQNFNVGMTKFWKFASELLGASINIYEKRIENTWINTNIVHDKLARMALSKEKPVQSNENQQGQQRKQSSEYLILDIQQFRDPKILDNVRIGSETLENPDKINIPKIKQQFNNDPLFQRKIKAFDNNSLKGLLLNVFDIGSSCQIQMFSVDSKIVPRDMGQMKKNQYQSPSLAKILKQTINFSKKEVKDEAIFHSVSQFRRNNAVSNADEQGPLDSIGFGTMDNKQNPIFAQLESFLQEPVQVLESQMPVFEDYKQNMDNHLKSLNEEQNTVNSQMLFNSQEPLSTMSQANPLFYSQSPFSYQDLDKSFHSVMTPWEMEFKDGKLRKKQTKGNRKAGKKRERVEPTAIQFDALLVQNKKLTLSAKRVNFPNQKIRPKNYFNLLPPQLAIYEKINYKRMINIHKKHNNMAQNQQNEELPDFLAPHPSMLDINPEPASNEPQFQTHRKQTNMDQGQVPREEEVVLYSNRSTHRPSHRKYNIRQTKKYIYDKVKDQRQVFLSEIDLVDLSPASALITFLHIANEKNMTVRNTSFEDDVILSWD